MAEIEITSENFLEEVVNSDIPVLLDFWATWCGPCLMIAPTVSQIAEEHKKTLKVGKVNVDEQGAIASAFNIESIPTLLVIKDGKVTGTSIGYQTKDHIEKLL